MSTSSAARGGDGPWKRSDGSLELLTGEGAKGEREGDGSHDELQARWKKIPFCCVDDKRRV